MKVLVLNCGSSSIKYQLFNMADRHVIAKGGIEKLGMKGSFLKHKTEDGQSIVFEGEIRITSYNVCYTKLLRSFRSPG